MAVAGFVIVALAFGTLRGRSEVAADTDIAYAGQATSDSFWPLNSVNGLVVDGMVADQLGLRRAIVGAKAVSPGSPVLYLSPQGRRLDQVAVRGLAELSGLILLAGRYEGIDERLIEAYVDQEWSIGDYVLSGGELPAMVLMDAAIRMLPGVLGHADSAAQDSFADGLLDCPHYTRPEEIEGRRVPEVLTSGNHDLIPHFDQLRIVNLTIQESII